MVGRELTATDLENAANVFQLCCEAEENKDQIQGLDLDMLEKTKDHCRSILASYMKPRNRMAM